MSQTPATQAESLSFPALHDSRYPVHKIADQLEPYLHVIVERFHPEKVILFGSQAYGQPTERSDVDLLIVRRGISSENQSNLEIRQAFWSVTASRPSFTILTKTPVLRSVWRSTALSTKKFLAKASNYMLRKQSSDKDPADWFM